MAANTEYASSTPRAGRISVAATLIGLGVVLIFITGFAHPQALHNAAHDARHALSYPCH